MCQAAWDLERGLAGRPAVKAEATLTLVLPKAALRIEEAQALVGANLPRRHLDLGRGYEGLRIPYRSPFTHGPIVRLAV